jgi:Response regulator of the LytR/AlgR family
LIRIAICDDEVETLRQTKKVLEEYNKALLVIDQYTRGIDLLTSKESYEIILLDIDMPGMNGIETAKQIRLSDKKVKIIYLTNYSDYTTFAFGVHAFAYLLKPVNEAELYKQLDEAFEYRNAPVQNPLEFLTEEGIVRVDVADIIYLEYLNRKVYLRTQKQSYPLKRKISDLAAELLDKGFAMPHKSFIVNLYAVKKIKGYDILLTDGTIIPLSQKKSMEFRKALNHYLSEGSGTY